MMYPVMEQFDFQAWLGEQLRRLGLKKSEAARKARLSPGYFNNLMTGEREPTDEALKALAHAFEVDPNWLLAMVDTTRLSDRLERIKKYAPEVLDPDRSQARESTLTYASDLPSPPPAPRKRRKDVAAVAEALGPLLQPSKLPSHLTRRYPPINRWRREPGAPLAKRTMAGRVGCGNELMPHGSNQVDVQAEWAEYADYVVVAEGVSMTGRGIMPFDLLYVKESLQPIPGNVVIAHVGGDEGGAVCRELHQEGGKFYLRSNQGLPYELEKNVEVTDGVRIQGVVLLAEPRE
jgi:SOS-response transcriptional repressor LexA